MLSHWKYQLNKIRMESQTREDYTNNSARAILLGYMWNYRRLTRG